MEIDIIDPDHLPTNSSVVLDLPKLIMVDDYHDFRHQQRFINDDLGLDDVYITEVGFVDGRCVGLVHLDTESHNQMVMELAAYYDEQED